MKRKLQLKQKIMIGAGAGLLGAAAIVTPLAVTLSRTHTDVLDDLDAKYGIDRTVYNNMKGDLTNKYRANLEREQDKDIDAKMAKLASSLLSMDDAVEQVRQHTKRDVYTSVTKVLMLKAKADYEIDLVRNSRANWNEIDEMFTGMSQSFETYMSNHGFDREKINEVLATALNQKEAIVAQLKTEYANDILSGVLQAKAQLLSCFDSINTEIARLAAETRLIEFTSNYAFQFKETLTGEPYTANRLDVLENDGAFELDKPISDENMQKIFTCFNGVTRQEIEFTSDSAIPGYKVTPIFKGFVKNAETNEYAIKIDWTAVSDNYAETNDAQAATAHLVDVDNGVVEDWTHNKGNINTIDDAMNFMHKKVKLTEYKMSVTADFEKQQLANTYFNGSTNGANIEFVWDKQFNPCYDGFMYADQKSTDAQTINLRQLAMTNIAIRSNGGSPRLLKDVIATVEQDNYEPKDMVEKFVKYCDITDTIKINRSGDDITSVTNNFKANYKNQVNWKTSGQESIGATEFGSELHAEDLQLSDLFFGQLNRQYNLEHHDASVLLDKTYNDLYKKANKAETISMIAVIFHGIGVIFFLTLAGFSFWGGFVDAGIGLLFCGLLSGAILGASIYLEHRFSKHLYKPARNYKYNSDEFIAGEEAKAVQKLLNKDLDEHFVILDNEHPYDPETYIPKLNKFKKLTKPEVQDLANRYYFFKTTKEAGKQFYDKATELHINPEQFRVDFAGWDKKYGEDSKQAAFLSYLMDATMLIESIVIAHLEAKSQAEAEMQAKKDAAAKKAAQETIDESSEESIQILDPN